MVRLSSSVSGRSFVLRSTNSRLRQGGIEGSKPRHSLQPRGPGDPRHVCGVEVASSALGATVASGKRTRSSRRKSRPLGILSAQSYHTHLCSLEHAVPGRPLLQSASVLPTACPHASPPRKSPPMACAPLLLLPAHLYIVLRYVAAHGIQDERGRSLMFDPLLGVC